ncbi:hypothetical protein [Kitasatospora sp. NBC_00039]
MRHSGTVHLGHVDITGPGRNQPPPGARDKEQPPDESDARTVAPHDPRWCGGGRRAVRPPAQRARGAGRAGEARQAGRKGVFDSTLVSPAVPIPAGTGTLHLAFDSHYRQEAPQKATVTAVFDDGTETRLLAYGSDATGNDNAGKDVQVTFVTKQFAVPAGARTVTLKFRMYDAGNN